MDPVTMTMISQGVSIAQGLAGFFGSGRERQRRAAKRKRAQSLLGQQYGALQQASAAERAAFATQRQFLAEAQGLEQAGAIQQQRLGMQQLQGQVGMTGLAGSGSGMQALMEGQAEFGRQQEARALQTRESAFQMQQREASAIRDIQSAGFQLDQYASEYGIKSSYGKSLLDMYGGI